MERNKYNNAPGCINKYRTANQFLNNKKGFFLN